MYIHGTSTNLHGNKGSSINFLGYFHAIKHFPNDFHGSFEGSILTSMKFLKEFGGCVHGCRSNGNNRRWIFVDVLWKHLQQCDTREVGKGE